MNKLFLYMFFLFVFCSNQGVISKQSKTEKKVIKKSKRKTVFDYYKLLPKSLVDYYYFQKPENTKFTVRDIKNGYLKFDLEVGWAEIALFKGKNDFIVVNIANGGPCINGEITVFRNMNDKLINVTRKVFPCIDHKKYLRGIYFLLPRYGKKIKVMMNTENCAGTKNYSKLSFLINFKNDNFYIIKKE